MQEKRVARRFAATPWPGTQTMRIPLLVVAMAVAACGPSQARAPLASPPATANTHGCADRVAAAFSSPARHVIGAYACLAPNSPVAWLKGHLQSDADFEQAAAAAPLWEGIRYIGQQADHGFVYEVKVAGNIAHLILWQGADGRVTSFNVASCSFTRGCGRPLTS